MALAPVVGSSFNLFAPTKPIPGPMTIAAVATGAESIRITWPALPDADRYNIEAQYGIYGWYNVGNTAALEFDDVGLTAETTYEHRAFAENADGVWGPVSNITSAITDGGPASLTDYGKEQWS